MVLVKTWRYLHLVLIIPRHSILYTRPLHPLFVRIVDNKDSWFTD